MPMLLLPVLFLLLSTGWAQALDAETASLEAVVLCQAVPSQCAPPRPPTVPTPRVQPRPVLAHPRESTEALARHCAGQAGANPYGAITRDQMDVFLMCLERWRSAGTSKGRLRQDKWPYGM